VPLVIVKMLEGRSTEQKRLLARDITDLVVKHAGTAKDQVDVIIEDYPRENWAKGGVLYCDKP
jgi:4-oxalocrotonate tautomerase